MVRYNYAFHEQIHNRINKKEKTKITRETHIAFSQEVIGNQRFVDLFYSMLLCELNALFLHIKDICYSGMCPSCVYTADGK